MLEFSPEVESKSNGADERAVKTIEGQTRTVIDSFREATGIEIPGDHPLISWAIQYASAVLKTFSWDKTEGHPPRESGGGGAPVPSRIRTAGVVHAIESETHQAPSHWGPMRISHLSGTPVRQQLPRHCR